MLCPSVISRFGTLADKQRFDAASANGMDPPCSCPTQPHSWFGATESGACHATPPQ